MKKIHQYLWACVLASTLYGCSTVPITGRSSLNLVSDETLLEHSRQQYTGFVSNARQKGEIVSDPRITQITQRLINATRTYLVNNNHMDIWNQMQWELNVVRSNELNAFCMPGGKIVVYTGLARMIGQGKGADDELAAVIGHEIAHAIARHANERVSRAQLKGYGAQILGSILGSSASGGLGEIISVAYGLGTEVAVALPFNRKQELEADKMGMVLMAIAGYNPEYAISLWQKMARESGGGNNSFLSTHPSEERRIEEIQKYMPTALQYYKPVASPVVQTQSPQTSTNRTTGGKTTTNKGKR